MARNFPSRKLDKFILRLPDGMRDAIAASAKANNRSMNAEIILRLENSLAAEAADLRRKGVLRGKTDSTDDDDDLPEGMVLLDQFVRETADRVYKELKQNLGRRISQTSLNEQQQKKKR
jgi:hypothetical protein